MANITLSPNFYTLIGKPVQASTTPREATNQVIQKIGSIVPITSIINLQTSEIILTHPFVIQFCQLSNQQPADIPAESRNSNTFISYVVNAFIVS